MNLSTNLIVAIKNYLETRPFNEVTGMLGALYSEIEASNKKEVKGVKKEEKK